MLSRNGISEPVSSKLVDEGRRAAHWNTKYLMRFRRLQKCMVKTADAELPLPLGQFEELFTLRIVASCQSP